jgi:3-dehydroquinate synthase
LAPIRLDVTSERGTYPVIIGGGLTTRPGDTLASLGLTDQLVVVSAPGIWKLHGDRWARITGKAGAVLIPDGEKAKTLTTVTRLYDAFSDRQLDRTATIVALGGGVIGDVTGFAAATYLRGLRVVQVPTTLLAQVDSAIGGKTGVNLLSGKNLVGSFHAPAAVLCDPDVLATLPRREFRAGLYEVIKYGVIASPTLLDRLTHDLAALFDRNDAVLTPVVAECCRIKAEVVMTDEREAGPRRALNFGHTVGHALEAITRYRRFRHGEAVGYGMLAAARLSGSRGLLSARDEETLASIVRSLGPLPAVTDLRAKDALAAIGRDKKVVRGSLNFVAAKGLGATEILSDVTTEELTTALRAIGLR